MMESVLQTACVLIPSHVCIHVGVVFIYRLTSLQHMPTTVSHTRSSALNLKNKGWCLYALSNCLKSDEWFWQRMCACVCMGFDNSKYDLWIKCSQPQQQCLYSESSDEWFWPAVVVQILNI